MTSWSDVITSALIYIDDIRLQESLFENPAKFYRKMSAYVTSAMPLVSRPPELLSYIQSEMTSPEFEDYTWVSTLGAEYIDTGVSGYDIATVSIRSNDGTEYETLTGCEYDSETGRINLPEPVLKRGETYEVDFYKDGEFNELTPSMMRLFGLAIAIVWDERFSRNWLNLQPKIKDASFETINESNYMDKVTVRMKENRQSFNDELRKYEQDNAYTHVVHPYHKHMNLI